MAHDFELLPHTADIKMRVYGATKQELFKNALIGMFQSIHPIIRDSRIVNDRVVCTILPITRMVTVVSGDEISLMVDFLSEALYLSDVHNEAYLDAEIHNCTDTRISATLYGASVQGFEIVEIKAVTYNELEFKKINDEWYVDIVFDI